MKADFGGGHATTPGFRCVDIVDTADYQINLDNPNLRLPFADDLIEEAVAHHFIEHIVNIIPFMNEVYRVLKPGALFSISTPHREAWEAYADPTHKRYFVEQSFLYFVINSPFEKEKREYGITASFESVLCERGTGVDAFQIFVKFRKPDQSGVLARF